ncbi:MAG: rhomboid family intramembrane serine protease, partial [Hyphomicrobiales bacterium]|nr:rhomboid family intramembrane serine protease [Hyphomicrobiales bacterium]
VDRDAHPGKEFALGRDALEAIGRDCLKYCGKVNRAQMPVVIQVFEVEDRTPTAAQKLRLRKLRRSSRFGRVVLSGWIVDASASTVWTNLPFNGRLMGRPFIENLLRSPRAEPPAPKPAALTRAPVKPLLTYAILTLLIGAYLCELAFATSPMKGLDTGLQTLLALGALSHPLVTAGQWFRLLSSAFLHLNLLHLAMNGLCLYLAGRVLEPLLGRSWLGVIFLVGALGGSAASLMINPPNLLSVGASGAIMALFAAMYMLSFRFEKVARTQLQSRALGVLVPSLVPLGTSIGSGRVDYGAHFGGGVVGVLLGLALVALWPKDEILPRFQKGAACAVGAGATALAFSLYAIVQAYPLFTQGIPPDQLPSSNAEISARATDLLSRFPNDPRSHFYQAITLMKAQNQIAAEQELRTALAQEETMRLTLGPEFEMRVRGTLATVLALQGEIDKAKTEARPACASPSTPESVRKIINQIHMCE